ncbi:MAG: 4-hydroxythreonine-4-phosphate dehydrogenase PdxA, partial [Cyanobacteria bacterium P01_F01_bin.42]
MISIRPKLAISLGDPAGVGPEVILKAVSEPEFEQAADLMVVGNRQVLLKAYDTLSDHQKNIVHPDQLNLIDISTDTEAEWGKPSAQTGDLSFRCLDKAIARALRQEIDGVVTAPIAKSAWKAAGHHYPGHTELLAERAGVERFGMMFVATSPTTGWQLRSLLVTTHIALSEVPKQLTPEVMTQKLSLLIETLARDFGIDQPKIAIAGPAIHDIG